MCGGERLHTESNYTHRREANTEKMSTVAAKVKGRMAGPGRADTTDRTSVLEHHEGINGLHTTSCWED
jgi:hypothetical protein